MDENHLLRGYNVFEVPYVNLSTEKDMAIIERNKQYANFVNSVAWVGSVHPPIMPLLFYVNLPQPWLVTPETMQEPSSMLLHCGYYVGKSPCWRNFDKYREEAALICFAVDYGMSSGMKAVYEKYKNKSVLVTLRGIEKYTLSGKFDLFELHPPTSEFPNAVPLMSFNSDAFPKV